MKSFQQFINEKSDAPSKKDFKKMVYAHLKDMINSFGYETKDSNSNELIVFTTEPKRGQFLRDLALKINSADSATPSNAFAIAAEYSQSTKNSSAGQVDCMFNDDSLRVVAKHAKKGAGGTMVKVNPGVENELRIVDAIKQLTGAKDDSDLTGEPINIEFQAKEVHTKGVLIKDVVNCIGVGTDTKDRKKADIILIDKNGKQTPISIKQDNAAIWESSDTYFGKYARDIFERLDLMAQVDYKKDVWVDSKKPARGKASKDSGYNWTLEKGSEFKVKITDPKIIKDVCFGNDILGKGFIIQKTFTDTPLILKEINGETRTFACPVTFLALTVDEIINSRHCVYLLCRNNAGRANATMGYRGLRVIVMMGDQRKNAREIDVDKLPPLAKLKRELVRFMSESVES